MGPRRDVAVRSGGQATVELALCLPVVVVALLLVVQVALVMRAQVLVVHAAREAAREAAVGGSAADVRRAAATGGLEPGQMSVRQRNTGSRIVEVEVTYRAVTDLPLVGPLVPDPTLRATVAMRLESEP